jgi:hypothetical protein
MITVYVVKENADQTEGRGPMIVRAAFTVENDAWQWADKFGNGIMGRKPSSGSWRGERYGDVLVEPLVVAESFEEHELVKRSALRKQALAKLTDAEKHALGIKD